MSDENTQQTFALLADKTLENTYLKTVFIRICKQRHG